MDKFSVASRVLGSIEHMFDDTDRPPPPPVGEGPVRLGMGEGGVSSAELEAMAPGPALAAVLDVLDPVALSGYDLVSFLGASERQASWTASRQLAAVAELAHRRPTLRVEVSGPEERSPSGGVSRFAALEVAAELRISRRAAEARIELALQLERLTGTREALGTGVLDLAKARAMATATRDLPDAAAAAVESRVLPRAPGQVLGGFTESLARAVLRVDPASARKRHERAVTDRKVELVPLADGMAGIWAMLRADLAVAVFEGITALAQQAKGPSDSRTLDQRRADVLADLGADLLARPDLPRRHGRRPHLQVTVAATTLLGLDEGPGELTGYGPITADLAREIAGDATWTRILTDPQSGTLLDYGTTVYRPPQSLADRLIAKHQRCRGPGCRIPARRCHLDHTRPFPAGPTAETNLGPLCQFDHIAKHETDWRCQQRHDGTYVWTSPTGHLYLDPLEPVLDVPDRAPPDVPVEEGIPPF